MDHQQNGAGGHSTSALADAVISPVGFEYRFVHGTGGLLVEEWDAVGKPHQAEHRFFVFVFVFVVLLGVGILLLESVGQSSFDEKRIAAIDSGLACATGVKLCCDDSFESFDEGVLSNGADAVGGRGHDFGVLNCVVKDFGILESEFVRFHSGGEFGLFEDFSSEPFADAGKLCVQKLCECFGSGFAGHFVKDA